MAIPLSNEMKEVQAPRTANLQAVNPMPAANQMAQAQSSFMGAMGQLGENVVQAKRRYDKAEDAFKRNEAERIYNETVTDLNTQLAEQPEEKRQQFQPKYEAQMKQASDVYQASINKIGDFEIREGSKQHINAWNQRNASNYQYENWKNDNKIQEKSTAQALFASNSQRVSMVTDAQDLSSLERIITDPNTGFEHDAQIIRNFYRDRMGEPEEVVEQRVKDYQSKALIAMANRYNQVTTKLNGYNGYETSLKLIDWGIQSGLIDPEEAIKAKRDIQTEALDACVKIRPEDFIKNGRYNIQYAKTIGKDLTEDELIKQIGKSSANRGAGKGVQDVVDEISLNRNRNLYNDMLGSGVGFIKDLIPENYVNEFMATGNEEDVQAKQDKLKDNYKQVPMLLDFVNQIDSMLKNNTFAIDAEGNVQDVDNETDAATLRKKGYKVATYTQQEELMRSRSRILTYLEKLNHTGKLDRLVEGGFLENYIPGFSKPKLTNRQTQQLKTLRTIFNANRPREILGWDKFSYNPLRLVTGAYHAYQRRKQWGPDWQLKARTVPMVNQINAALANTEMALSEASRVTGISMDDAFGDTANKPVKPQVKRTETVNGETKTYEGPDEKATPITFNQAYAYYLAAQTPSTLGEDFMKTFTNNNLTEAQKIAEFSRTQMSEEFLGNTETYAYRDTVRRIEDAMNPFTGILSQGLKEQNQNAPHISGWLGNAIPSDQQLAHLTNKFKQFLGISDKKMTPKEQIEFNHSPLGSFLYELEDGDVPGQPKSYARLAADKKVANAEDAIAYVSRYDDNKFVNNMIDSERLLAPYNGLRLYYVDDPKMQQVLSNRVLTYTLGTPEDIMTRDITLDQIAEKSSEMSIPETPISPYSVLEGEDRSKGEIGTKKVVFLTPDGYNYLWSDNFLSEFDYEPSKFYALLGLHKSIMADGNADKKGAKLSQEPNPLSVSAYERQFSFVAVPDKDKPYDFR